MIDFHTHIIPNIDDGSRNIEETLILIKEAEQAGFKKIISTSHYIEGYYETENIDRQVWIDALNEKIKEQNMKMELYLGSEIYFTDNIINLIKEGKAASINGSKYLLFEMPLNAKPLNLYDMIYEVLRCKMIPILAHPERYSFVQNDTNLILDLIEKGVLMQCNFGSFIGVYGSKAQSVAKELLQRNMVHFLGTDVHRPNTIYPKIPKVLDLLKKYTNKEKIFELTELNPETVINDGIIDISEPKESRVSLRRIFGSNGRRIK